ncbi:MAG: 2-oxo acid dehydrogenase subunit E2 [Deltaproteobacteria bacterium]|nr:2-oxo acid dehydrogenase subunit E2 [Deltaproteobacteria bacterium]
MRIARYRFANWTLSVHTRVDIDFTGADRYLARTAPRDGIGREHLWLWACARVIRERPLFNAAFDGFRDLRPREDIHLRVSVRTPTGGLGFVVVEHADRLDPRAMAERLRALAASAAPPEHVELAPRTRTGRLGRLMDDLEQTLVDYAPHLEHRIGGGAGGEAGTFTVLDAGAWGAEDFHAVLLRPALAMLVVMAPRTDVVPGAQGPEVAVRVPMAVPFCHKMMDTDAAGYFLFHMQQLLDDPDRYLGKSR